jgi:hypothetical protein
MKYEVMGFDHDRDEDGELNGRTVPRGISIVSASELQEHVTYALLVDKCAYVTVYVCED